MISASTTPSPLPSGFGLSDSVPAADTALVVRAVDEPQAGKVVVRLHSGNQGVFRVSLSPGPTPSRELGPRVRAQRSRSKPAGSRVSLSCLLALLRVAIIVTRVPNKRVT